MSIGRRQRKSKKIGNHHYFKNNQFKAIENYLRHINADCVDEDVYVRLGYCYRDLENLEKALYYTNKWLEVSGGYYDLIELKGLILVNLWREEEAKVFLDKIILIDEKNSKTELNLDAFYNTP